MTRFTCLISLLAALGITTAHASLADDLNAAHDAAHAGNLNKVAQLAGKIDNSPLEMYPHYWLLAGQLDREPESEITPFLERYAGSYLADRLRADWLRVLGKRHEWTTFEREWPKLIQTVDAGSDLQCYRLQLAAARHDDTTLLQQGKPLWLVDKGMPEPCAAVYASLFNMGALNQDDAWTRIRMVFAANNPEFAAQLLQYVDNPAGIDARRINAVAARPEKSAAQLNLATRGGRELAIFAVLHAAHSDLDNGPAMLERLTKLPAADRQYAWSRLAMIATRKLDDRALGWFERGLPLSALGADGRAEYVRAALRQGDWGKVAEVIDAMGAEEQANPTWTYWRARAARQAGNVTLANKLFASIAGDQSFYSLLAREELGTVVEAPAAVFRANAVELSAMRDLPAIQRALALYNLDWRPEAVREWNWGMRGLSDEQLLAAAELARQAGWYDRAIYSAEHTRAQQDNTLRYLAPYRDITQSYARSLGLDEAWVYGLIRQESRFVTVAHSSVGAHGLMQLMPGTARWVARKLGVSYNPSAVNEIGVNIQLGTFYLKQVLDSLGQQPVLATAAYNAGPGRARAWRGNRPMEGAIYAETAPFLETRDYIKKVMANSIYYAEAFEHGETSLKKRLGTIPARGATEAPIDLP
ncbi:MAG: lytic transglycosylase domain-containing protein [Burkholderiales bacterium]|nr:lytic transglycosylase domain-containing protein [Burkholderiales bacterium]